MILGVNRKFDFQFTPETGGGRSRAPSGRFAEIDGKVAEGFAGVDDFWRGGGGDGVGETNANPKVEFAICTVFAGAGEAGGTETVRQNADGARMELWGRD